MHAFEVRSAEAKERQSTPGVHTRRTLLSPVPAGEFSTDSAQVLALASKQVALGVQTESFGTSSHWRNSTTKTTFGSGKINKPSVILAQTWQLKQTCFSFKNFSIAVPRGWTDRVPHPVSAGVG